jgi:diguanylate cyclase (GGDEF)-like protein
MQENLPVERAAFLSTDVASRPLYRVAVVAVLVSGLFFCVIVPFAKTPLAPVPAFIPTYATALVICDAITAVLLFGQFNILRSPAPLILASGYLFTAAITFSYALMFPGLVAPTGLLGAGPQSTSAMYMIWHGGFPLIVMGYALLRYGEAKAAENSAAPRPKARVAILFSIIVVLAIVFGVTLLVTAGHEYLPVFIQGDRTTALGRTVLSSDWILSLSALVLLWRLRLRTVFDLWLMVVMCVWLFDISLSAILNTGRYDLGWYAGRIYGLLAAGILLVVLLVENGNYYARLVRLSGELRRISLHDWLTNLPNRRFFDIYLDQQVAVAHRHKRILALILCDIDSFKAYNDHYGHQAGDECLKQVAAAVNSCCRRPADMAARYGGEEFAMILPDTELIGAGQVAEAARDAVAQLKIPHEYSRAGRYVSISGGISVLLRKVDTTAQQLIAAADQNLYVAKNLGRNQMVSAEAEPG